MSESPSFGPERDRRRRRRILTKRNVGITILVLVLAFMAISIWSEVSDKARFGKGRLYSSRTKIPELAPRAAYEVVPEQEISSSRGADPLLLESSRREQLLGVEPGMLERQNGINPDAPMLDVNDSSLGGAMGRPVETSTAEVKITGGPEGVRIEQKKEQR